MNLLINGIILIFICLLAAGFVKLFKEPMKLAFKVLLNILIGFIALILINFFGSFIGISIGINWINALIIGLLGVPGVALLLVLQWLLLIL